MCAIRVAVHPETTQNAPVEPCGKQKKDAANGVALLLGAGTLLGTKGIATRSKDATRGAPGLTTVLGTRTDSGKDDHLDSIFHQTSTPSFSFHG